MGYIKKLKNNELVGGTDKTTIYPVTSTKAVFEEVTEGDKSSFKSQETINGEHDNRIKGLENEMPDTVKSITINGGTKTYLPEDGNVKLTIYSEGGEDYPSIAEAVQNNADNIDAIQNEIGTDTTEDTLSGRIKSLENAVGTGGSVDQRISDAIGNINAEHSDMDPTDHIQYQIIQSNGEITDLTIQGVDIASADALEALRQTYEGLSRTDIIIQNTAPITGNEGVIYRVTGETTYTDYMFYNGQRYTMATYDIGNLDPQVSYYACATPAATPAKAATGTDASAYTLTLGGHFKVEMDEANTAPSGVTLQVGNAAAKELMYNGASVNAENTWEAGEVIAVYYYNNKYWASNAQGGSNKKIDAYLLGDLRTLAVGQVYREGEFIKTTDKQLLKIVKPIRYMMLDEPVAVGDARVVGSITYVANTAVSNYNESTTYTEGAYALIDGRVNVFDGETWTPVTSVSAYAAAPIWDSVDANYLSTINNGFVAQNTTESHIDDDILKRVGDYTEIISIPLSGRNSGHIYAATGGVITINESSSTNNYCVVNPVDVTQYSKVYINYCIPSSAYGGTYFTDDNGFIIGSVLKAATNNNTYYEYDVPEGATKLYVSNARNYAINNIKIDTPRLKAKLCKTVKDNTDILYKRTDYLTDGILPIKLNTIYHIGEILKSEDGSILVVNKNVAKLKNTENLAVGDIKIYNANLTYQAKKAITEYTGDDTNYTDGDYARGTFASKVLNISVDNPTEGEITIKVGDEEYSVPITSESTDERLAETIAELVFSEWSGSANGSAVTFVHSTIGAISDPFTITVSSDSGVTITPSYTNGTEIIRVYNEGSWTNISTFSNNDLSALFDEIDNVDTLASIITVSDNIHNHINAEILMSLPDYCGNYIGSSGTLWKSATDTINAYLIPIEAGKYYKIKGTPNTEYAFMSSMSMSGAPQYATGYSNVIISGEESSWLKAPNNAVALYALGINDTTRIITVKTKLPAERLVDSLYAKGTSYNNIKSGRDAENVQDALDILSDAVTTEVATLNSLIGSRTKSNGFFKDETHYNKGTSNPSYYGYWYDVTDYVGRRFSITANSSYFSRIVFSPSIITTDGNHSSKLLGKKLIQTPANTTDKFTIPSNGDGRVYLWVYTYNNGLNMTPASIYLLGDVKDAMNAPNEKLLYRKEVLKNVATASLNANSGTYLKILTCADIHGNSATAKEFMEVKNYYNAYIDFAIHVGDSVATEYADPFTFWNNNGMQPVWNVIGNHDCRANGSWSGAGKEAVHNRYIAPYIDDWGVTKQDEAVDEFANYYYKDFTVSAMTVRVLCLDALFTSSGDPQFEWLQDKLDEAKLNGYHVVIFCHYPPKFMFTNRDATISTVHYQDAGSNSTSIPTLSTTIIDKVLRFIKDGGNFVMWFNGHRHYDELGYSKRYITEAGVIGEDGDNDSMTPNVLRIPVITLEKCSAGQFGRHESKPLEGELNEHSFTFIFIDPKEHILKWVRYGNNINSYMKPKNFMCYKYDTKNIIGQG